MPPQPFTTFDDLEDESKFFKTESEIKMMYKAKDGNFRFPHWRDDRHKVCLMGIDPKMQIQDVFILCERATGRKGTVLAVRMNYTQYANYAFAIFASKKLKEKVLKQ